MSISFKLVPDYICSGVVEHYFKLSVVSTDDASGAVNGIFSVIINQKTDAIQRQAKIDNLNAKRVRTAVYGYGTCVPIGDYTSLANAFMGFDSKNRQYLRVVAHNIRYALAIGFGKPSCNISQSDKALLQDYIADFEKQVMAISSNTFTAPVAENESECKSEPTAPVAENVAEDESPMQSVKRKTKQVARLIMADMLTEFASGNIYDIATDAGIISLNGNNYIPLVNDNGEIRYINAKRVAVVEQYAEPPQNCD